MLDSWFDLLKISFGIAMLWMVVELAVRPIIRKHNLSQLSESARQCYTCLLVINKAFGSTGDVKDFAEIISALSKYKDSIGRNPRLSRQTGHADMYQKIKKIVAEHDWSTVRELVRELGILTAGKDQRRVG